MGVTTVHGKPPTEQRGRTPLARNFQRHCEVDRRLRGHVSVMRLSQEPLPIAGSLIRPASNPGKILRASWQTKPRSLSIDNKSGRALLGCLLRGTIRPWGSTRRSPPTRKQGLIPRPSANATSSSLPSTLAWSPQKYTEGTELLPRTHALITPSGHPLQLKFPFLERLHLKTIMYRPFRAILTSEDTWQTKNTRPKTSLGVTNTEYGYVI